MLKKRKGFSEHARFSSGSTAPIWSSVGFDRRVRVASDTQSALELPLESQHRLKTHDTEGLRGVFDDSTLGAFSVYLPAVRD